jgi:hypothetical protein
MTDMAFVVLRYLARMVYSHPITAGFLALWLAVDLATHWWLWACVAVTIVAVLWLVVKVAWTARQGSALSSWYDALRATIRIHNVKRRWQKAARVAGFLARHDKEPPYLVSLHAVGPNVAGILDLGSSGFVVEDVVSVAGRLASTMRCGFVRVLPEPGVPSECQITFEWRDPLDKIFSLSDIHERMPTDNVSPGARSRIPIAVSDLDSLVDLNTELSALFVGESGSGKSSFVWAGLAGFQVKGIPVRLRVIDPAGGVELSALKDAGSWVWTSVTTDPLGADVVRYLGASRRILGPASPTGGMPTKLGLPKDALRFCEPCLMGLHPMFHVHAYTDRARDAETIVDAAHTAMFTRLRSMDSRQHRVSPEYPHDLTIVDEMLLLKDLLSKGVSSSAGELLTIGRKAAFTLWGCSQLPQKDALGDTRDLFPQRFCFAVRNREATDIVLGPGASASGARAHTITDQMRGVGYRYSHENRAYARFRGPKISDKTADRIARGEFARVNPQIESQFEQELASI